MAKREMSDEVIEIQDQPGDGVVPAEDVTSENPKMLTVRACVHTMGLDAGDTVEIEDTPVVRGLIGIGHFVEVREKA